MEADAWTQLNVVRRWQQGEESLVHGVLEYWAKFTERFAFTRVLVVDSGFAKDLELHQHLQHGHGAEAHITPDAAVGAELAASVNAVIPLETPELASAVRELEHRPDSRLIQVWAETLTNEQAAVLSAPKTALSVHRFLAARFTEYVLLAEPFGAIGLTAQGKVGWVPLTFSLTAAARSDTQCSDAEFLKTLKLPCRERNADPVPLGLLTGACFEFDSLGDTPMPAHFGAWLKRQHGCCFA